MENPLRIAMIAACPFPSPRGTPVRIYRMAEALAQYGHSVDVITYHLGGPIEERSFRVQRIPHVKFYHKMDPGPTYLKVLVIDQLLAWKTFIAFLQNRYDIIHAHHFEGLLAALPIRLLTRTPIVFDIHTLAESELHHYNLFLGKATLKRIAKGIDQVLPKFSHHMIAVSAQIRSQLIEAAKLEPAKITILPNGVELEKFIVTDPHPQRGPGEEIILGYAGNFSPYQQIRLMLEAFREVSAECPNVQLDLISDDSPEKVAAMIAELELNGRVRIKPSTFADLPRHLSRADILLNPRLDGAGLPIKLLNYMAAAKPIVSFIGSAHILEHQKTAWVVTDGNAQGFAAGILNLIADKEMRQRLGESARHYVQQNHVWSANAALITGIYRQLLDAKAQPHA